MVASVCLSSKYTKMNAQARLASRRAQREVELHAAADSFLASGAVSHLASAPRLWQHRPMIAFRPLPDDHPDLAHSPLLRAALLTLRYAQEHGAIGLTKSNAFKRVFVHWAVEAFNWPGKSAEEMFRYNKVINGLQRCGDDRGRVSDPIRAAPIMGEDRATGRGQQMHPLGRIPFGERLGSAEREGGGGFVRHGTTMTAARRANNPQHLAGWSDYACPAQPARAMGRLSIAGKRAR